MDGSDYLIDQESCEQIMKMIVDELDDQELRVLIKYAQENDLSYEESLIQILKKGTE